MAKIPKFDTEEQEAEFWDTHDSTDFLEDTEEVVIEYVDARPKTLISLRLPSNTIEGLKALATRRGIGYQTMIRMWVMERLEEESRRASRPREATRASSRK